MVVRMASADSFFNEKNEATLQRALYNDVCRRIGGDLSEKQANRLVKTVRHYMEEVYDKSKGMGVKELNMKVLTVSLPDYLQYLNRGVKTAGRTAAQDVQDVYSAPSYDQQQSASMQNIEDISTPSSYIDGAKAPSSRIQMDVTNAFAALQAQRQEGRAKPPPPQDFRMSLQDEPPVNMDRFSRIKEEREAEAKRVNEYQLQRNASGQQGLLALADAGDAFQQDRRRMESEAEDVLAERERARLEARAAAGSQLLLQAPPPPDMRALFMGDRQTIDRSLNQQVPFVPPNTSAGNPTLAQGVTQRETSAQQMIITREPDMMTYKETELNLFVYSADRDWVSNSQETRYNFSVNFDPANLPTGLRLNPTSTVKFRNITRIELVKAIMPGESVDTLVTRAYSSGSFTYSSPYNINILSFPYVQVRIPELDNNVYGTNQALNAAFGVLQYDANWIYDTNNESQRGYFAMIPKFLKCQKVYAPTPLSTLNKLSFRFERPDGTLVSTVPDTLDITRIYSSKQVTATNAFPFGFDNTYENGTGSAYYFIKTSTYFNALTVTVGDRIIIKNLTWAATPSGSAVQQLQDFLDFIQEDGGFLVVDVGYGTAPAAIGTANITRGANQAGYCNYIIVRGKFTDPTTGGTTTTALGGKADASVPGTLTTDTLTEFLDLNALTKGRLLNYSHQVQVSLRVIVRELDSTGFLRPDNL